MLECAQESYLECWLDINLEVSFKQFAGIWSLFGTWLQNFIILCMRRGHCRHGQRSLLIGHTCAEPLCMNVTCAVTFEQWQVTCMRRTSAHACHLQGDLRPCLQQPLRMHATCTVTFDPACNDLYACVVIYLCGYALIKTSRRFISLNFCKLIILLKVTEGKSTKKSIWVFERWIHQTQICANPSRFAPSRWANSSVAQTIKYGCMKKNANSLC